MAKVAQLKPISIRRLELMAAIAGLQIPETARQTLDSQRKSGSSGLIVLMSFPGYVGILSSSNHSSRTGLKKYRPKPLLLRGATH